MSNMEFSDIVLRIVSEYARSHINTSLPAIVTNVDNLEDHQTIDVLPMINDTFDDGTALELPPILDVPVIFPSAGGGLLSFPVKVGDPILLIFSKRSLDEWMESRSLDEVGFTPEDKRYYSLNDAVAFPGLYPKKTSLSPNPTDVELKFNSMSIKLEAAGNLSLTNGNGSNSVDLASSGIVTLSNAGGSIVLNVDGSITFGNGASISAAGDVASASGKTVDTHRHTQGNDGAGDSQQTTSTAI